MQVPYTPPVLKLGDRSNRVYAVKRALLKAKYLSHLGPFPKLYGPRVAAAVTNFQLDHAVTPDGRVGRITLEELGPFIDEYGYYLYTGRFPNAPALQLPATFTPTHQTGGLPGFPAIDCFAAAGTVVLAPEDGSIQWPHMINWNQAAHVGGGTCYFQGDNCTYFLTHFQEPPRRDLYRQGDRIGVVGAVPHGWWPSHIHEGKHQGHYEPPQP